MFFRADPSFASLRRVAPTKASLTVAVCAAVTSSSMSTAPLRTSLTM